MNAKKCILALIVSFIVMFLLSGLWHMYIMGDFYMEQNPAAKSEVMLGFVILGYAVLALLMAYAYPLGYKGGSPVGEGLRFGILIGLLWLVPRSIVLYGVENTGTGLVLIVDGVWHLAEQGIGGIIIGLIYGRSESGESTSKATE